VGEYDYRNVGAKMAPLVSGAETSLHSHAGGGGHPEATHTGLGLAASHSHPYASDAHDHDAEYSALGHSHGGGGNPLDAWPVGSVFIAVVSTSPATLLGGGTWARIAEGRMLVGQSSGDADFDTAEETGGAKTHALTASEMPTHTHVQNSHNHTQDAHSHVITSQTATTGGATSYEHGALDTSSAEAEATEVTNPATATNQAATATNQNAGGGGAHNNLPPYLVAYLWKRTA
jgi:microcystin-dependent protein